MAVRPTPPSAIPPRPAGSPSGGRSLTREGRSTIRRIGQGRVGWIDVYVRLLTMRWRWLFALVVALYIATNALFAGLYLLIGHAIDNARDGSFWDAFFFSVQTMATIGYGKMTPATSAANVLVTIEALLGMLGIALATGLIFAKFARPAARVLFSDVCAIGPRDGILSLAFRVANERASGIVEAQMRVGLLRDEVTLEGERVRRFLDLPLQRSSSAVFALTWVVVHRITPDSPLHGLTEEQARAQKIDLIASMVGLEEVSGQTIHARHGYAFDEVEWGRRFVDIMSIDADGGRTLMMENFHLTEPVP